MVMMVMVMMVMVVMVMMVMMMMVMMMMVMMMMVGRLPPPVPPVHHPLRLVELRERHALPRREVAAAAAAAADAEEVDNEVDDEVDDEDEEEEASATADRARKAINKPRVGGVSPGCASCDSSPLRAV
ncbi:unnamed protein product [Lampetra fluviatilis]